LLVDFSGSGLRLAIVPRKPERFQQVEKTILKSGFNLIKFSQYKHTDKTALVDENTVILVDTMGDLRKFYSLSTINFVGRSLVPMGGSDMIESAALGKFTIFGKYIFNFRQDAQNLLQKNGALKVDNPQQLCETIKRALTDMDYQKSIADNGRAVILANKGATQKTAEIIKGFLAQ
jgi:3-deoxy-D-manno-octulosonic-acid transferase